MVQTIKGSGKDFGKVGEHAKGDAATIEGAVGAQHTYLVEERNVVARLWNKYLEDDEYVKDRFPMVAESDDLFHVMADGMVLIRLINEIEKDSIDMRTVNIGSNLGIFKVRENINLALTAAKGMIKLIGIDATAFLDKKPHLILAVCWQIARKLQTAKIQLKDCPEIMRLAKDGEELNDLLKVPPEDILVRWINFHLKAAGQDRVVTNLGKDLKDCQALYYVLNQLDKTKCPLTHKDHADELTRAQECINNSRELGVCEIVSAADLMKGNSRVNTAFVAEIFNTNHGLQ
jgi:plastin-1